MIRSSQLADLKSHAELLAQQVTLFENKIKTAEHFDPYELSAEEEKRNILRSLRAHRKNIPKILSLAEKDVKQNGHSVLSPKERLVDLLQVNDSLFDFKNTVVKISKEHDECGLDLYKKEIIKALELVLEPFDFILPNIRYEIEFLEKFYREPQYAQEETISELNGLIVKLHRHDISLSQFLYGLASKEGNDISGYFDLRARNQIFHRFQYFEHSPEGYKEINSCYYEICTSIEPLLKEKREEKDLGKFWENVRRKTPVIEKMSDIFIVSSFIMSLFDVARKKYTFTQEYKKCQPLIERFSSLKKKLITYNNEEISKCEKLIDERYKDSHEREKLETILHELRDRVENKDISFEFLGNVFSQLLKSDFNVFIKEKSDDDISISSNPYLEKKYKKELIGRVNLIIEEIDFWYPPDRKQSVFEKLGEFTKAIERDEEIDRNNFFKEMQVYDKELEEGVRLAYPDKLKELQMVFNVFQKTFSDKMAKAKLSERLANPKIWEEISPKIETVQNAFNALQGKASGKSKPVAFLQIKTIYENLCQVLYDLSMQTFVLFDGVDERDITNMTNILAIFNEYHDVKTLWATFFHYNKKLSIPSFLVNEQMIKETTKNELCKLCIKKLYQDESA